MAMKQRTVCVDLRRLDAQRLRIVSLEPVITLVPAPQISLPALNIKSIPIY